jgi:uncharacterized protein (TIRG00374 family)
VLGSPQKVATILWGNFASQVLYAVAIAACVRAFGSSVPLLDLLYINTFVTLFAGLMPVPGGIGVSEAALTAGLVAAGLPEAQALAIAVVYRMCSFYVPPVWGFVALRWLQRHDYL